MNGGGVVFILLLQGDEGVGILDAVDEVGASLDHALVDQLAERLVADHLAQVVKEFVPETGIDQVAGGMLGATHVEVHLLPVAVGLG